MESTQQLKTHVKPIIAYGNTILRKACDDVENDEEGLIALTDNLWKTLEYSGGVGLAAPQINSEKNIFVVDSKVMFDSLPEKQQKTIFSGDSGIHEVFINARIVEESEEIWTENEGCLSIPGIDELIDRAWSIKVEYYDEKFKLHEREFSGYTAKVIQHELDHTNGILFIDHLHALKRKMIKNKLKLIIDGKTETEYPINYLKHKTNVKTRSTRGKRK